MLNEEEQAALLREIEEIIARLEAMGISTESTLPLTPENVRVMDRRDDDE